MTTIPITMTELTIAAVIAARRRRVPSARAIQPSNPPPSAKKNGGRPGIRIAEERQTHGCDCGQGKVESDQRSYIRCAGTRSNDAEYAARCTETAKNATHAGQPTHQRCRQHRGTAALRV